MSLAHDLVEHKYWGVDGARVEATGLAPLRIHCSIPLINTIVPGPNERWNPKQYPDGLRALLVAFAKKSTGVFQHPEFGEIACKGEKFDADWDGSKRGGVDVECSWVETKIDNDTTFLDSPSPVQEIELAALDLDNSADDLSHLVPTLPVFSSTLGDFARAVTGISDQVSLFDQRLVGKIDAISYRVETMEDSIDRARTALTWPVTQNIERLKAATFGLREKLLAVGRDIVVFTVKAETTLAGIYAQLPDTKLGDLMKLNPSLMSNPAIPAGTAIRYYAPSLT